MAGALDVEHEQLAPRDVNVWCMSRVRTNIEIEDTYLRTIMHRYGLRTKTEAVDLALRHLAVADVIGLPMDRTSLAS